MHYVPQYYLSGFSDPSLTSQIWVYQKGSQRIFSSTIKNVANENKSWPNHVEEYLANKIETPANHVLDKIRSRQPITRDDKDILSDYIVVMLERVPEGLNRTKAIFPTVIEQVFSSVETDIMKFIKENPSKKDTLQNSLQKIPSLKYKYETEFPMELWYQRINPKALPGVRMILPAMTWAFMTSDNKQPFLTNDNPVFFFKWLGIGKPESELIFPICSDVMLWATWHKKYVKTYISAKDALIREFNRRTASNATKYVFYSMKAEWVVNLINKKTWGFKRIA